jgi:hypothetical protein
MLGRRLSLRVITWPALLGVAFATSCNTESLNPHPIDPADGPSLPPGVGMGSPNAQVPRADAGVPAAIASDRGSQMSTTESGGISATSLASSPSKPPTTGNVGAPAIEYSDAGAPPPGTPSACDAGVAVGLDGGLSCGMEPSAVPSATETALPGASASDTSGAGP